MPLSEAFLKATLSRDGIHKLDPELLAGLMPENDWACAEAVRRLEVVMQGKPTRSAGVDILVIGLLRTPKMSDAAHLVLASLLRAEMSVPAHEVSRFRLGREAREALAHGLRATSGVAALALLLAVNSHHTTTSTFWEPDGLLSHLSDELRRPDSRPYLLAVLDKVFRGDEVVLHPSCMRAIIQRVLGTAHYPHVATYLCHWSTISVNFGVDCIRALRGFLAHSPVIETLIRVISNSVSPAKFSAAHRALEGALVVPEVAAAWFAAVPDAAKCWSEADWPRVKGLMAKPAVAEAYKAHVDALLAARPIATPQDVVRPLLALAFRGSTSSLVLGAAARLFEQHRDCGPIS